MSDDSATPLFSPTEEYDDSTDAALPITIYYSSSEEENDEDDVSPLLDNPRSRRASSTTLKRQKKNKNLGTLALALAVLIASSKDAVFKRIFTSDDKNFNACNVLCGSNLLGLLTLPLIFKKDLTLHKVKSVKKRHWAIMLLATTLYSVLGPMIYLMGLQMSDIIDAAILSRLESLEFLLLATFIIPNSPLDLWAAVNALIVLSGVVVSLLTPSIDVDKGDGYIILGGSCFVLSLLLTKRFLSEVPVGILGMFRVSMGTIVYHTQSMIRSVENNEGYLNWQLWKNLWWFALIYVTLFQAVWLFALQNAKSVHISVGTTGIFLLSLGWAYAIIPGTTLTDNQKISCFIITGGVVSGIVRGARAGKGEKKAERVKMKDDLVRDSEVGTRGVI